MIRGCWGVGVIRPWVVFDIGLDLLVIVDIEWSVIIGYGKLLDYRINIILESEAGRLAASEWSKHLQ